MLLAAFNGNHAARQVPLSFTDTLTLDAPRKTANGYMAASVRVARTGVQVYTGAEVGRPDLATVRVYRSPDEVFHKDSLRSLAHKPVTVDHPPVAVDATNWRDYAVGWVGDEIARDGEFVRVPLALMDARAIATVEAGRKELSCGYQCDLAWGDGVSPQGEAFDAEQKTIRYNHLSAVGLARGGPDLRIGDAKMPRTITHDGISIEASDQAAQAYDALAGRLKDSAAQLTAASTQVGTLTATVATKDGEIAALKQQLADATLTPAKLDAAVAARSAVVDAAKRIIPTLDAAGKTEAEIRRAAVAAKLGDAVAAGMNDDGIGGAFNALAVAAPVQDGIRQAIIAHVPTGDVQATADAAFNKHRDRMRDAWKGETGKAN